MDTLCGGHRPLASLSQQTVTKRNKGLAPGDTFGSDAAAPFWEALHRRTCDRIAWPWARWWLQHHARLEPSTAAGWPSLRLVFTADPPREASAYLLTRHYGDALAQGCKGCGPLADLAGSLELREVAP
jgi:hypothetical protein